MICNRRAWSGDLNLPLGKRETLLYRHRARIALFPDSSAVEQSTVNRLVASSNLARGASFAQLTLNLLYAISSAIALPISMCVAFADLIAEEWSVCRRKA
jgi:hypothetical protein